MLSRRTMGAALAAAAGLLLGTPAGAQTFPTRPVTIIVPFAAGGPSDAIARLLGQSMSVSLGQPFVIENVAGAGGTTGAARLAKADPDGHTLLIHHIALVAGAYLYRNLPYETSELETVGLVNFGPMVLATRKDYPASTPAELLARLRTDGTRTTFAHAGIGSNAHLCGLLLQQALGIKLTEVAYRGTGPAMNDLMGGQVDTMFDQSTTAVPQLQAGTVKGFAVTSPKRLAILPELPTMKEAGLGDVEFVLWHGLYAPHGTPAPTIAKLNGALRIALKDATIRERFAGFGTELYPEGEWSPAAHRARFDRELATWREVIAKSGVSVGN